MTPTLSFDQWLRRAPLEWFEDFVTQRRDLMRAQSASMRTVSTLAAHRSSVRTGLLLLDAPTLQWLIRVTATALGQRKTTPHEFSLTCAPGTSAPLPTLERAALVGLLWPADGEPLTEGDITERTFELQPALAELLGAGPAIFPSAQQAQPLTAELSAQLVALPDSVAHNAESAAMQDILNRAIAVGEAFATVKPSQLTRGGIGVRDAKKIATVAGCDYPSACLFMDVLHELGWVGSSQDLDDPQYLPTRRFDEAQGSPRSASISQLLERWLCSRTDVTHLSAGQTQSGERVHPLGERTLKQAPYPGIAGSLPQALIRRLGILHALAEQVPAGQAAAVAHLSRHLVEAHPLSADWGDTALLEALHAAELFGLVATPLAHPGHYGLTRLGQVCAHVLKQAGLTGDPRDLSAVAVELAENLRAHIDSLLPPVQDTFIVQSDLSIVTLGPLDPQVRLGLVRIAALETRGVGATYRLTKDTVEAALRSGMTSTEIVTWLQAHAQGELPGGVEHAITDISARLHGLRVWSTHSVLTAETPEILEELLANPTHGHRLRRISPTVAISELGSERIKERFETPERPILNTSTRRPPATRAPVPTTAVQVRSQRVSPDQLLEFARALRATAGERRGADQELGSLMDEIRAAAQVQAEVDLVVVSARGLREKLRMRPQGIRDGRLFGSRSSGRDSVSVALSRLITAERVGQDP